MKCDINTDYCANNEFIEILNQCNPENVSEVINLHPYWKQMYLTETVTVPQEKPDIETINSVDATVQVLKVKVIKTPVSTQGSTSVVISNLEGKKLTGRKIIIEGVICLTVEYTAEIITQPVHSAHFYIPFSAFIIVPENIPFTDSTGHKTLVPSLNVNFEINACVEDVSIKPVDPRNIISQITFLLYAVPNQA